jgi:hypothetical protein
LNGTEVARDLLPATVTFSSTAVADAFDDGQSFNTFPIPVNLLQPGTNVLAVEIHQRSASSTDVSFDLELSGLSPTLTTTPGDIDGDGDVDRDDVVVLAQNYGLESGATRPQGDLSGDEKVGLHDIIALQANFGTGSGGAAVPEPATALTLLVGLALLMACHVRRRTWA